MTKDEILDINGKTPQVGDTIALATGWATENSYLNIAVVDGFEERPKTVKMNITINKSGLKHGDYGYTRKTTLQFPMKHCKFLILNK